MKRSTLGKVFLLLTLALAWTYHERPTLANGLCKGTTEETCADNGCDEEEPVGHYACTWSHAIDECGCMLLHEGEG